MFEELEQDKVQSFDQSPAATTPSGVEPAKEAVETTKLETPKEQNIRLLRERAERAEREVAEYKKNLEQMKERKVEYEQPKVVPQGDDDDFNIDDDSYIEAKYVKQLRKEVRETRKQIQEMNQMSQVSNAEMRLKSEFPDIMDVVTPSNIQDLKAVRPDIFENLMYNPDMYKRGKLMREMIKDHVLSDKYEAQDKRIEDNRTKPRSSATVPTQQSETPLTRVGDYDRRVLTEARKEQLRLQVAESKKYK